jgi:hypothetical protein
MADSDLSETIREAAQGPARVSADGTSVDAQDLSKLIEADRYLAAQQASDQTHFGLRFVRLDPPRPG